MLKVRNFSSRDKTYLITGSDIYFSLKRQGDSPYEAVNFKRIGLRKLKLKRNQRVHIFLLKEQNEIIDLRDNSKYDEWWFSIFEVIDKKKFFLARIQLGF